MQAGETFLEKSFPRAPFKRLETRVRVDADPGFYRFGGMVRDLVCALDDWRSRPAVALRVRLRASPSAQDDTMGRVWQRKLEFTLDLLDFQHCF